MGPLALFNVGAIALLALCAAAGELAPSLIALDVRKTWEIAGRSEVEMVKLFRVEYLGVLDLPCEDVQVVGA
jgi:hypothetical protein